jgi:hypothetical protein
MANNNPPRNKMKEILAAREAHGGSAGVSVKASLDSGAIGESRFPIRAPTRGP